MKVSKLAHRVLAAVAATAVVAVVGACGSTDDSASNGDSSRTVEVQTVDGPVTIKGTPERVVTLGSQWTETAIALGTKPVAFYDAVNASTKTRAPWLEGKVGDSREVDTTKDLVTQIADLDPDLIFVSPAGVTDEAGLKKLRDTGVPVIAQISKNQVDSWQDLLKAAGQALNKETEATDVAASINGQIEDLKKANPGLKGKNYTFAAFQSPTAVTVLADNNDGAAALFNELGMSFPQAQLDRAKTEGTRFSVSPENVQILDSDLLVIAAGTEDLKTTLQNLPSYKSLRSVQDGAVAFVTYPQIFGLNTPSALSVPSLLDTLKPALEAAAK